MPILVKDFSQEHLDDLKRIFVESRRYAFSWMNPESFKLHDFEHATLGEQILVALDDNKPVGFIAWWSPDNFIHSLFVDPEFIGSGIGKLLLKECIKRTSGPTTLKCLQANEKAINFYKSQGWEIESQGVSADGPYYQLAFNRAETV